MQMCFLVLVLTVQGPAPLSADRLADVYFLFVEGRSLAEDGNLAGGRRQVQAGARRCRRSPRKFARNWPGCTPQQNDLAEAEAEAGRALATEPTNRSAHRLLGLIQASRARARGSGDRSARSSTRPSVTWSRRVWDPCAILPSCSRSASYMSERPGTREGDLHTAAVPDRSPRLSAGDDVAGAGLPRLGPAGCRAGADRRRWRCRGELC